jgi:UDP-3-O-[3-hydroxymyristoyl] glucosamine N-acyltransferase
MLSILKNAGEGSITYYVGDNPSHILHLKDCTLYCKKLFNIDKSVNQIIVDDPQLEFYKLSHSVEYPYNFEKDVWGNYIYTIGENCNIHPTAVIGKGVVVGNNVTIGPNSVIYSNTNIGNDVTIDANCTIGTEGMMWVWDNHTKVYLKQLGGVIIKDGVRICSGCVIVRGSANENTIIDNGSNIAPGCTIGHGVYVGKHTHLANNITIGGSAYIGDYNFVGGGVTIRPSTKITANDVILGTGCVVTNDISESGVYVGVPAKRIKNSEGKLNGMPKWRK